jgi:hypothetical protein
MASEAADMFTAERTMYDTEAAPQNCLWVLVLEKKPGSLYTTAVQAFEDQWTLYVLSVLFTYSSGIVDAK